MNYELRMLNYEWQVQVTSATFRLLIYKRDFSQRDAFGIGVCPEGPIPLRRSPLDKASLWEGLLWRIPWEEV